jgi:hypothetical protein
MQFGKGKALTGTGHIMQMRGVLSGQKVSNDVPRVQAATSRS